MISIILVSLGASFCVFGLFGFLVVIYFGLWIKNNSNQKFEESQDTIFKKLIILNYLALILSAFGLITLLIGLFLK
jgi:uncharacterized membrane protein YqjE